MPFLKHETNVESRALYRSEPILISLWNLTCLLSNILVYVSKQAEMKLYLCFALNFCKNNVATDVRNLENQDSSLLLQELKCS